MMIHIQDLSFEYKPGQNLFNNLDLNLDPGNIYGLLGKNGAGKTTLLKLIGGLLFPHSGECSVMDHVPELRLPQFLRELFFIPEEFYLPPVKLDEYIKLYTPFYPRFNRRQFNDYRDKFDLPDNGKLTSLSYGQKKKLLLAFGLATDCRLLILDEPTNGLDIPTKSQFRKLLAGAMNDERTFIISTHQVRDMENLIDPIIILDEGHIIFDQDLSSVTDHLAVQLMTDLPAENEYLYQEKVLGGYAVMQENTGRHDTKIDLELLFNAVINNREKMAEIFLREVENA